MAKGGSYLAPYHGWEERLPAEVKEAVAAKTEEIIAGTFRVDVDEGTPKSD